MKETFIKIHPSDSVAVATQEAAKGTKVTISGQTLTLRQDIPFGHKVALCDIAEGKSVIKYGAAIGHATETIHICRILFWLWMLLESPSKPSS